MSSYKVKQHDATDCGPACLSSVCRFYGLRMSLGHIRQLTGTNRQGTTMNGLKQAALKLGFETKAVMADKDSLLQVPKPAIAHLKINNALLHYVVVLKVSEGKIDIMDPGNGLLITKTTEQFLEEWTGVLLLLVPGKDFRRGNHQLRLFNRFMDILRPHRPALLVSLLISLAFTILGFTVPLLIQVLTDRLIPSLDINGLILAGLLASALVVAQMGLNFYKDMLLARMGMEIDRNLIGGYYHQLMKLPLSFFDKMKAGELISRVGDAVKIRSLLCHTSVNISVNGLVLIFSVLILFSSFWKLGILVLSLFPIYLVIYSISNRLYRVTERKIMEYSAAFESQMVETVTNIRSVNLFGIQNHASGKTLGILNGLLQAAFESSKNQLSSLNASRLINALFAILLLCYGSVLVIKRLISLGELLSFYAITAYFTGPIMELILVNKNIQNAKIAAERLFYVLDLPIPAQTKGISSAIKWNKNIELKGLRFSYDNGNEVLKGVEAYIAHSSITAITGKSGSGKSTLLHLIQGLYPNTEGSICLGKQDLSVYPLSQRHPKIASVPQKIEVFSGSVMENVALGQKDPDPVKVGKLVKRVGLDQRFGSDGQGLGAQLGENGATLSGGEFKKLGLARALYLEPSILLLDEVTSSLDTYAELEMMDLFKSLSQQGLTIVITSHKWSTLVNADQILVLDKGRISERGTPRQLMQSSKFIRAISHEHPKPPALNFMSKAKKITNEQPQTN